MAQGKYNPLSKNFFLFNPAQTFAKPEKETFPQVENDVHRLFRYAIPLQLERIRVDLTTWRQAIGEAENAYVPYRVKMQQIYIDKVLEGHVASCLAKRNSLTLKKTIKIGHKNELGEWEENKEATKLIDNKRWVALLLTEILNAQYYGYSLVQLGDLVVNKKDYKFSNIMPMKRWLVRPDYFQYCQLPYTLLGFNFTDPTVKDENGNSFSDWLIYIDTPSENGSSICGYGLLYKVAQYAIILRNNLAHNADFNQMFVAPYRHLKTDAEFDSSEYNALQDSLEQMASNGYVMTGLQEELEFIQGNTGTGYQSYADLEQRCQKIISKLLLGHANALDAQNTALGGGKSNMSVLQTDATPEGKALAEIEQQQDKFVLSVLNDNCYDKFVNLGFPLPEGEQFYFPDDDEKFEQRVKEDAANQATANIMVAMKQSGLKPDAKYFEERTGIPTTNAPEPVAPAPFGNKEAFANKMNKVKAMYNHQHDHE